MNGLIAIALLTAAAGCGWQSQALAGGGQAATPDPTIVSPGAGTTPVQQERVEQAGSVRLSVPERWRRIEAGERVLFVPPEAQAHQTMLSVEPGLEVAGRFDRWFATAWSDFVRGYRGLEVAGPVTSGRSPHGYEWRWQLGSMEDGVGNHLYVFYCAARKGSRVQPIILLSTDAETFNLHTPHVGVVLQTGLSFLPAYELPPAATEMPRVAAADLLRATGSVPAHPTGEEQGIVPMSPVPAMHPQPSDGPVWGRPGGSPLGSSVPGALDGIYQGLSRGLAAGAADVEIGVSKRHVTFYPDGRVFRRVPEGGLEGFDRDASETAVSALWGRYRQVGAGRWEIHWNDSERVGVVEREGEGLRFEGEMVFPVASCEGLRLDGTFNLQNAAPELPFSLTFDGDGRFRDDDLVGALAYENIVMPNPRTIAGGSGTYRIGRNTLYLTYDDGRLVLVAIHASREAIRTSPITNIAINGWPLVRRS